MILCLVCRSPNLYTKAENLYVCNDCGNEWEQFTPKVYAVDFDGYLCKSAWPDIGEPNTDIIEHFKALKAEGHKLILWTCREGEMLQKAIDWCASHGLTFDAHNANLPERMEQYGNDPRKIGADYYCDDKNYWLMPEGIEMIGKEGQIVILPCSVSDTIYGYPFCWTDETRSELGILEWRVACIHYSINKAGKTKATVRATVWQQCKGKERALHNRRYSV